MQFDLKSPIKKPVTHNFRSFFYGALFQLLFAVLIVAWLPLQEFGYGFYESSLFILPSALLAISMVVAIPALLIKKIRFHLFKFIAFAMGVFIAFIPSCFLGESVRMHEFRKLAERSDIVITAISSFSEKEGRLPNSLQELVPNYLKKYPTTGMAAYPGYDYSPDKDMKNYSMSFECSTGILNWDLFIYHSNQDYSNFETSTKKFGKWIYFYE